MKLAGLEHIPSQTVDNGFIYVSNDLIWRATRQDWSVLSREVHSSLEGAALQKEIQESAIKQNLLLIPSLFIASLLYSQFPVCFP